MITQILHCLYCQEVDIVKNGKNSQRKQRYQCREQPCDGRTFFLDYSYLGQSRKVKDVIVDMALNGSGIRDIVKVLHISTVVLQKMVG